MGRLDTALRQPDRDAAHLLDRRKTVMTDSGKLEIDIRVTVRVASILS